MDKRVLLWRLPRESDSDIYVPGKSFAGRRREVTFFFFYRCLRTRDRETFFDRPLARHTHARTHTRVNTHRLTDPFVTGQISGGIETKEKTIIFRTSGQLGKFQGSYLLTNQEQVFPPSIIEVLNVSSSCLTEFGHKANICHINFFMHF